MQEVVKRFCMRCFCRSAGAHPAEARRSSCSYRGPACHLFLELPGLQSPARRATRNSQSFVIDPRNRGAVPAIEPHRLCFEGNRFRNR